MRTRWLALMLLGLAGCYRSAQQQADAQRDLTSGQGAGVHVVRQTLKLRVYADASSRTRDPAWDLHIRELVERANHVLSAKFGVRLEVSNTRVWQRSGGDDLQQALAELEKIDPGEDTGWIVGLMAAPREVTSDIHALGASITMGHHMVLRGTNDTAEYAALAEQLADVPELDRGAAYRSRKANKELVVFMHHLGHTLGAPHPKDPKSMMAPTYDPQQTELGPLATRVFFVGFSFRDQLFDAAAVASWRARLAQVLTKDAALADVQDLARVRDIIEHPWRNRGDGAPKRVSDEFDHLTKETFGLAEGYVQKGELTKAWTLADVMIQKHPDNSRLLDFGCNVRASLALSDPDTSPSKAKGFAEERELCARAADASELPTSEVFLARLDALVGNGGDALSVAREADQRLTATQLPATAPPEQQEQTRTAWTNLASIYASLGCIASSERAARIAGGDTAATIAKWSIAARRQQGLPPGVDVGVTTANDCEYAQLLRDARENLTVGHLREARTLLTKGRATYPNAPGLQVIGCELEARQNHPKEAREQCTKALVGFDDQVRAHQLLGFMEARAGNLPEAVHHLSRAVELDPDLETAWIDLAKLYMYGKDNDALTALQEAYKQRFGKDMPAR